MTRLTPEPADKFTFGLWTVGNRGRDPFGEPTRPVLDPVRSVQKLAELGAFGVNFHDNDLVPIDATPADRDRIVRDFRRALEQTGLKVPMATTNLFGDPAFKDGAFTSHDPNVRAYALQKTMRAMDLGVELRRAHLRLLGRTRRGGSRRRQGSGARRSCASATPSTTSASTRSTRSTRCASRSRPSRTSRAATSISRPPPPTWRFIPTLAHPEMVGVNPEVAHEQMAGLNFFHAVAQAIECGKLFHIDLNDQKPGRFDQDLRFASESIKPLFFLVKLLEESGYDGPKHFDAHAYRSESDEGVWDFARGCMRTYLILKEKARQFREDARIQALLAEFQEPAGQARPAPYTRAGADALLARTFDREALAARQLPYERLDQLVIDLLLGV